MSATSYWWFYGAELLLLRRLKVEIIKSNIAGLKLSSLCCNHNLVVFMGKLVQFHSALLPKVKVLLLKLPNFYPRQVSLTLHVNLQLFNPTVVRHLKPEVEADAVILHNLRVADDNPSAFAGYCD